MEVNFKPITGMKKNRRFNDRHHNNHNWSFTKIGENVNSQKYWHYTPTQFIHRFAILFIFLSFLLHKAYIFFETKIWIRLPCTACTGALHRNNSPCWCNNTLLDVFQLFTCLLLDYLFATRRKSKSQWTSYYTYFTPNRTLSR